jgi:hypothetical protein
MQLDLIYSAFPELMQREIWTWLNLDSHTSREQLSNKIASGLQYLPRYQVVIAASPNKPSSFTACLKIEVPQASRNMAIEKGKDITLRYEISDML